MVIERVGVIGQTVLMAPYHKVGGNTRPPLCTNTHHCGQDYFTSAGASGMKGALEYDYMKKLHLSLLEGEP